MVLRRLIKGEGSEHVWKTTSNEKINKEEVLKRSNMDCNSEVSLNLK